MKYPINWNNNNEIRKLFTYQTRIGIAPKFGSRPISWYQGSQCRVYNLILETMKTHNLIEANVKCIKGRIYFKTNDGLIMGPSIGYLYEKSN